MKQVSPDSEEPRGGRPQPTSREPAYLMDAVYQLERISARLTRIGLAALAGTAANIAVVLLGTLTENEYAAEWYLQVGAVIVGVVLLAVAAFDTLRKRGDALFQEVSDELQWFVGRKDVETSLPQSRPFLPARVALRSFANAAQLPLVPGVRGPGLYAVLNLALVLAAAFLYSSRGL
jgi:hypothetical protein